MNEIYTTAKALQPIGLNDKQLYFSGNTNGKRLQHESLWRLMEQNAETVAKMPAWVKGSPVNYRTPKPQDPAPSPVPPNRD
jgi:hypothetical protein